MSRTPPNPPSPPQAPELVPPEIIEIVDDAIAIEDEPTVVPASPGSQPFTVPASPPLSLDDLLDVPSDSVVGASAPLQLDLDDLPTPSASNVDIGNIDLPTPAPLLTPVPSAIPQRPQDKPVSSSLDDLPDIHMDLTQEVTKSIAMPDLSPPPSLMDDLPAEAAPVTGEFHAGMPVTPLQLEVDMGSPPAEAVSEAVDLSSLPDLDTGPQTADNLVAVNTGMSQDVPSSSGAGIGEAKAKRGRRGVLAVGGLLLMAGAAAAVLLLTPAGHMLGLRPAARSAPVAVVKPAAKPVEVAKRVSVPAAAPVETPKPAFERLTRDNVDRLGYTSLAAGVQALAHGASGDSLGLLRWARFRLANSFADPDARAVAIASLTEKPEARPTPLSSAALAATALMWGKPPQIKHAMAHLRGPATKTPQGLFTEILAQSRKKVVAAKTLALLDRLREQSPAMIDADFLRAELLMGRKERSEGARALVDLARRGDPDANARAATALQRAEDYAALQEAVDALGDGHAIGNASPAHQDVLWRWLVRGRVLRGDVSGALQAATARTLIAPQNVSAWVEAARLTQYTDGDGIKVLSDGMAKVTDTQGKARLVHEKVVLALRKKDDEAVQSALKEALALPLEEASGWTKMAEGLVAQTKRDLDTARAAYAAASKGRPGFDEPKVALMGLHPARGDEVPALLKWPHRTGEVVARTVAALEARGDYVSASKQQETLLWTDPTLSDPVDGVLHWIDLIDRSGEALRAETLAEHLAMARADDDRPPLQIVEMAARGKRYDSVFKWYGTLLTRHPNHRVYTVALANSYIEANKNDKALVLLEALAKADPEARNEEFLYTEGRAWGAADVVKARGFLQESLKLKPNPRAYIVLGELEQQRGKNDEALEAYRQALQLDPNQTSIQLRIAKLLTIKGFTKEAIEELNALLQRNPKDGEAGELLGDALREQGDKNGALAAYLRAESNRPDAQVAPLLMKTARLQLQELGQTAASLKTLHHLLKVEPKNAEAHYYMGLALRDTNKRAEARQELQTYLRLAPSGEFASEVQDAIDQLERR